MRHHCTEHTGQVVAEMGSLRAVEPDVEDFAPDLLASLIYVEAPPDPELPDHPWEIGFDDDVRVLIDPDRDDLLEEIAAHPAVASAVQLDREVIVVYAPRLCEDGLRAVAMRAVAAANGYAHEPRTRPQPEPGAELGAESGPEAGAGPGPQPSAAGPSAASPSGSGRTPPGGMPDEEQARLVTGAARTSHGRMQVWVNMGGILVLPADTLPHGPLDPSDNPRFQRAELTEAGARLLAAEYRGRWLPYGDLDRLAVHRPRLLLGLRWRATLLDRQGHVLDLAWRGTRPHVMLLWGYTVAKCGLDRVDGLP